MIASLALGYLILSLMIGTFITLGSWEGRIDKAYVSFIGCVISFAFVWPVIALYIWTERK